MPQWNRIDPDLRQGIDVVSRVLPFRTNCYVLENLIEWSNVPDDPIFQLVFPQRGMLYPEQFRAVESTLWKGGSLEELARVVSRVRLELNPHPGGQLTHNVPVLEGRPLPGLQHKYAETVLLFPAQGQTCHVYCTYCFRWAQFVGIEGLRFATPSTSDLVAYLKAHPEITDVLITGGDPMIMQAAQLRRYIEPLLSPELEQVRNIRIGTKALTTWPSRFTSNPDADACLRLFEEIVAADRHLAVMGHYSHPVELEPETARAAVRRVRSTGAEIRMQAPLVKHINDSADVWAALWRTGVRLGLVPYYMFVERDTGPRNYFEVPLARACEIFKEAFSRVSGLARTAKGPAMSAFPGKVRILDVRTLREILGDELVPSSDPEQRVFLCDFIQARDPAWIGRTFFAAFDPRAAWFDQLKPAFRNQSFPFPTKSEGQLSLFGSSVAEALLH